MLCIRNQSTLYYTRTPTWFILGDVLSQSPEHCCQFCRVLQQLVTECACGCASMRESTCNQFLAQVLVQLPQVPLIDWKPDEAVVNPFWHGLTSVQPHWPIKLGEGATPRRETGYTMCATYFIFLNKPPYSAFRYNNFPALPKKKCLLLFDALL